MHANIMITLRHETGRSETIPYVRNVQHTSESTIEVEYRLEDRLVTDEYDGLSWQIESVSHTETPIGE